MFKGVRGFLRRLYKAGKICACRTCAAGRGTSVAAVPQRCLRRTLCLFCSASASTRPRQCLSTCKSRRAMSHADRRECGAWTNTAPQQKLAFAIAALPPVWAVAARRGPIMWVLAILTTTAAMHTRVRAPQSDARKLRLETASAKAIATAPAVATMAATAAPAHRCHHRRLLIAHAAPSILQHTRKRGRGQKMGSAGTATRRTGAEIALTLTNAMTDTLTTIAATRS